jgi:hypothetical protein
MNPAALAVTTPLVAGLGQGVLHGGLSAYGNLAEENDRSKGDQRMILESVLAALGGGLAGFHGRRMLNGHAGRITQALKDRARQASPQRFAAAKQFYQGNPILNRLSPEQWVNLVGTSMAAGAGAGIAGGNLAPFLADQLGLLQMPGSWTARADDWNWDRQTEVERQIADQVLARLQAGGAA